MSVIYKGSEYKATSNGNLFSLDLSARGIEDLSEIKGFEKLTWLHILDLSYNNITEIKGLENLVNLKNLKKLYLGNNPIYKNLKNIFDKKKKLMKMTGGEREKARVNPKVWKVMINSQFRILKKPSKLIRIESKIRFISLFCVSIITGIFSGGISNSIASAMGVVGEAAIFSLIGFLVGFCVPLLIYLIYRLQRVTVYLPRGEQSGDTWYIS